MAPSSPLSFAARTVGESSDCPSDSEARLKLLLAAYWTWHLAPPESLLLGQWANHPTVRATPKPVCVGHGRRPAGCPWGTEDENLEVSGLRKTTSRISLGHGRRRAEFLWVTEDDQPDFSGSRKTTSRMSLGHGRRAAGFLWGAENEHAVGCGDARPSRKIHYDRASFFRC